MNRSDKDTPLARLYAWEADRPDQVHFTQPLADGTVVTYTWREAMDQTRRIAAWLVAQDFPRGSRIALLGKNSAHWMMADWAIWMAGHITVPLYPSLAADTVRYILGHSEAKVLLVGRLDDDWKEMKAGIPSTLPLVALPGAPALEGGSWDALVAATAPLQGRPDRSLDELATIIYTSGSTGTPKGVMQSFGAFNACGRIFGELFGLGEDDRVLSYLPLAHALERSGIETVSVYQGCQVFFSDSLATFVADLRRAAPTFFASVPRLWTKFQLGVLSKIPKDKLDALLANPATREATRKQVLEQLGLQNVRMAVTGSAPLPATTVEWYRNLGLELLEGYGMTENFAVSHFSRRGQMRLGYVGSPVPGVECRIADNGEVLIKSPGNMMGYYREPEKSAESFTEDGFFKTGDMGEIDAEGRLKLTGRIKELFKTSKGKYVAPVPIENRLNNHPQIEVVCVGGNGQPATYALILLGPEARANPDRARLEEEFTALLDSVNVGLDPHEQMAFAVVVKDAWSIENGYLTPTMKIRRNVIEQRYEPLVEAWFREQRTIIWE